MNWKLGSGVVALIVVLACSKGDGGLSVRARTGTTGGTGGTGAASLTIDNGLVVERVRLVIREVELEPASCDGTGGTGGDDTGGSGGTLSTMHEDGDGSDDDGDDCELEFGPFLVDLSGDALTGPVSWVADVPVPAGTYRELEFKVNTIPAGKAGDDAGLLEMANRHASVVVDGRLPGGEPFSFQAPFEVEQEREGVIEIDPEGGAGVTLELDPTHWFTGAGGAMLDPRDVTNQGAIRENIRASIRLHHDDDGDGCDDDVDPSCDDHSGDD